MTHATIGRTDSRAGQAAGPATPAATEPAPPAFRRDVAGLRAVAILLVAGCNAGLGVIDDQAGIDIFFVISGFLITGVVLRELRRHGRLSLRTFYARRVMRLVPASSVVVLGTLAAAWHWLPPAARGTISWDSIAAATATMNVRLATQPAGAAEPSALQHFWSLGLIGQFYLVWPVLLIIVSLAWARRGRPSTIAMAAALTILSAASLLLCLRQSAAHDPWAYYGLPARAWEFALGALVALAAHRLARLGSWPAAALTWLGLGAVGVSAFTQVRPGPAAALPVLGTILVIAGGCARPAWGARRLLRIKPLQEIGRVSLSWYLWHWPLLVLAPYVLGRPLPGPARIALVVVALVPAAMSVAAVENRIRLYHGVRLHPGRALAFGGLLSVAAVGLALLAPHLPVPAPREIRAAPTAAELLGSGDLTLAQLQQIIRDSSSRTTLPGDLTPKLARAAHSLPHDGGCLAPRASRLVSYNMGRGCERRGLVTSGRLVVLFGDSHAQQWYDALDVVARKRGWRIAVFTKADCGPALGTISRGDGTGPYTECDQWRLRALARIQRLRPAMVIMSARYREGSPLDVVDTAGPDQDWAAAWAATVERVRRTGAVPVVVQDAPAANFDVPRCLAAHRRAIRRCDLDVLKALPLARQRVVRAVVQVHGARVVDTNAWFCTPSVCPAVIGNTVVYRDDNHLTSAYARRLGGLLDTELPELTR
ncbi:acyltransferase family protein [Actinoplanes sp. NPDC026623]|uniref:acyltransferase family protein n=1 Tax=Actinoplanes sp. NPDC026623 TaxID=3155610 RepID=UPI0033DC4F84